MPFPVKYNSGNVTGSIVKGNVALAVNDIVGPTSVTGWYNGPNFTQGTYQIVETSASGDPEVFCPQNEAELVKFAKWKGALSGVTGSSTDALLWIGTQPDLLAINEVYPNIVTDGCTLNLDAGFAGSYPLNPFQVNLIYSNGVYSPLISNLTIAVTQSTLIPNNKFRITTPSNYISPYTSGNFRIRFPLSVLVNAQPYNLSFKYQLISGSSFSMTDWNDTALFNVNNTNYGTYIYSSAAGVRSTYDDTYRFMDFDIQTSSIVDIWDIQLTQNVSASLFNTGSGTTWYDVSGNNRTGSLVNGMLFNPNNYMLFDGVDDFISLNTSQSLTNNYTLRYLFKTSRTASSTANYFNMLNGFINETRNSMKLEWNDRFLAYNNSSSLQSYAFIYPLVPAFNLSSSFSDMQITVDSNNIMTVYNNGVACTPTTTVTGSLDFQVLGRGAGFTAESIAGFQLYNRVLSQAEILQNYYQAPIVTSGLVFAVDAGNLVSFERGSLITNSLTGSSTGSLVNGTGYTSSYNGVWSFDGTDDRLTFGSPNMTSSCTVNQWIQPLSGSATTMGTITYVAVNSATSVLFSQLIKSAGTWYHQVLVSGYQSGYAEEMNMYFQSIVTSFVENNTPYNFTFTWERTPGVNSTLKTYLNGVYREQQINTNNYWANTASLATATYNISNTYKGNIGTTSFYNRALTETEITQNYNAQKARFGL
jgi:hypothetical protein